ncbi:MAG: PIN domain-containing protein [Saccharospirillum sp.]
MSESKRTTVLMYLLDTNVVSELRKQSRMDLGVRAFFEQTIRESTPLYLSVVAVGELHRGVELIRHRGDIPQAEQLEQWLNQLMQDYANYILPVDMEMAQLWGKLRAPGHENALDKQIAATALVFGLTVVTRNVKDFTATGVALLNPFQC